MANGQLDKLCFGEKHRRTDAGGESGRDGLGCLYELDAELR